MLTAILASSVLRMVSAYSKCNPADVKGPISLPITKVLAASSIQVSGNIEIVDGCTFKVTGFSLTNATPSKWYGGIGSSLQGITLADDLVSSSAEQTFKFREAVGSEVSFRDFDQFRLLEESSQTLIATAQVPSSVRATLGPVTTPGNQTVPTTPGTNVQNTPVRSTSSAKPTQPAESSAQMIGNGILGLLMIRLSYRPSDAKCRPKGKALLMFLAVLLLSFLSIVSAYSKCNPADVKGPINLPISKVLSTTPIEISGNIQIVDGCTFKVTGFTFYNARTSKWYGGTGSSGDAITLSDTTVNPSAGKGEQTFKFRDVAGAQVSFKDFDQFRLFDEEAKVLIATAQLPANLSKSISTQGNPANNKGSTSSGQRSEICAYMILLLVGFLYE